MDNIYIVESPLQALCALEASLHRPQETHGMIVRISQGLHPRNDQQVLSIIHKRKWDYLSTISYVEPKNLLLKHLRREKMLTHILSQFPNGVSRVYIGEFNSVFMHRVKYILNPDEVFLLEDGTATFKLVNRYLNKGYFYPKNYLLYKNRIKKVIPDAVYFKTLNFKRLNKEIKLLTAYTKINYDLIEPLTFSKVKALFKTEQTHDPSLVYYYGSRYSELKIVNLDYEIAFLTQIATFYQAQNKRVVYFAHRNESPDKLSQIEQQLGFSISMPQQTAEVYLLEQDILPGEIASAFSSLLINCRILFPELCIRSFKLSNTELSEHFREEIETIYNYLNQSNVKVTIL